NQAAPHGPAPDSSLFGRMCAMPSECCIKSRASRLSPSSPWPLGIGVNGAIFSVMNASLLARIPIPSPDRVFMIWTENAFHSLNEVPASVPDYLDWKASGVFQSLGPLREDGFNVRMGSKTERIEGLRVTPEWFDIQGVKPYLGRLRDGLSVAAARQRLSDLSARLSKQYRQDAGNTVALQPIKERFVEDVEDILLLLLCAVTFVLLVACANVANLLLVRGAARR